LAAGACLAETWLATVGRRLRLGLRAALYVGLAAGGLLFGAVLMSLAPVNSDWWKVSNEVSDNLREQLGWPELTATVAGIRDSLPAPERASVGILAANYGEAGAIDLYGPAYGLPRAISGINSYWLLGYPDPPPQTLIVVGLDRAMAERIFANCTLAGHTSNQYGVLNEETRDHPDIFVCRDMRVSWPEFWKEFRYFG
jgi:hypothetical protein